MFYTIYKTTNNINGKYYIGKHTTLDLDDTYIGSGTILKRAINKYGIDNFTREYLFIFDNEEDMNNKELELVNESFIKEDTNYNLAIGGKGGFSPEAQILGSIAGAKKLAELQKDKDYRLKVSTAIRKGIKKYLETNDNGFKGKSHTEETKEKMRKPKNIGKENPQYGMMWIYSLEEQISKRISKDEIIPEGWYKGRKMKF